MGYVKEPEGVDLIINGGTLSSEDTKKVSAIIQRYKKMSKAQKTTGVPTLVRSRQRSVAYA
jgi:hypothetical protein